MTSYEIGQIPTHNSTPGLTEKIELENPTGPTSEYCTLGEMIASIGRTKLTANTTFYVRTDGNDSNNGLTNSSGGAFLTLQAAWNAINANYDFAGFTVTLEQGTAGTLTGNLSITAQWTGAGAVIIDLGGGTLNYGGSASAAIIVSGNAAPVTIQNGTIETSTAGVNGIQSSNGAQVTLGSSMTFGACGGAYVRCVNSGQFTGSGFTGTGNASQAFLAQNLCRLVCSGTITLTGTPAFADAFADITDNSYCELISATFSGSATGTRFNISQGSVLRPPSQSLTALPGNGVGITDGTSVYGTLFGDYPISTSAKGNASYTLVLTDIGTEITFAPTTAQTLTIPLNSSVAFPIGTKIFVTKTLTSTLTIAGAAGVTVRGTDTTITSVAFGTVLRKIGTDTWISA